MTNYTIRTDVPVPKIHRGPRTLKYPFAQLGVGHSFVVQRDADKPLPKMLARLQRATAAAGKKYAPAKFTARVDGDAIGVWRVK